MARLLGFADALLLGGLSIKERYRPQDAREDGGEGVGETYPPPRPAFFIYNLPAESQASTVVDEEKMEP